MLSSSHDNITTQDLTPLESDRADTHFIDLIGQRSTFLVLWIKAEPSSTFSQNDSALFLVFVLCVGSSAAPHSHD